MSQILFISGYDFKLIQKFYGITNKAVGDAMGKSEATVRNIHKLRYVRPQQQKVLFELTNYKNLGLLDFKKLIEHIELTLESEGKNVRVTRQMINLPILFHDANNSWQDINMLLKNCEDFFGIISIKTLRRIIDDADYLERSEQDNRVYYRIKPEIYNQKLLYKSGKTAFNASAEICGKRPDDFDTSLKSIYLFN